MKVKRRKSRVKRGAWLFILPILLLHIFTILVPALVGIYFSLTDWSGFGPATFIGLENYRTLFEDPGFLQALRNNFKWLVFFATVPFSIALTAAFLLSQVKRGGFVYRIAYFVPYVLPAVVIGSLWKFILNPDSGITSILSNLGIPGFEKALLGQPSTALLTIAFVDNWHYWGFLATILLVALQSVSPELYEAAKIDGANLRQQFRHVTIPGIRPTLVFMFMITSIWSFLVFEYVWVMSQGGPAGSTEVMATYLFKAAFREFSAGLAAAAGLTMTVFAGTIIGVFLVLRKRGWEI